ncbi:MAG TPA: rhomboid family intramembrane serine protease [Planctomycetota bacterium]|nr:rhomboid family intramembrane serine protease [Planctomycetota bacterium]
MPTWDEITPYTERSTFSRNASVTNALFGVHVIALAAAAVFHFTQSKVLLAACGFHTVPAVFGLEAWRFVTYPFAHRFDPASLAAFVVLGWLFIRAGNELEREWGGARMLGFVTALALYGGASQAAWDVFTGSAEKTPAIMMGGFSAPVLGVLLANTLRNPRRPALFMMLIPMRSLAVFWLVFASALLYGVFAVAEELKPVAMAGAVVAMVGAVAAAWTYSRLDPRLDRFLEWLDTRRARAKFLEEFELRAQVDVLLEKIQRSGLTALTRQERKTLRRASGLYKPPARPTHE